MPPQLASVRLVRRQDVTSELMRIWLAPEVPYTFEKKYPHHFTGATSTGVVPYVSIIQGYLYHRRQGHRFYVPQAASYQCGHPGMIKDVKARLLPKGWQVKEERFWKE